MNGPGYPHFTTARYWPPGASLPGRPHRPTAPSSAGSNIRRKRAGAGAFTLIEVLVSLAIFALAAVVLAAAYLNVLGGYQAVARRQQGEENWKLVRMAVLSESDRTKLEAGGRLPLADGSNLHWTVKIEGTAVADLFAVTVRAEPEFASGSENPAREQQLMLLRPGWSDPAERDKLRAATQQRLAKQRGL